MTNRFTIRIVEIKSRLSSQQIMALMIGLLILLVREVMIVLITVLHQVIMIKGRVMTGQPIHLLRVLHHHLQGTVLQAVLAVRLANRTILPEANHLPMVTVHPGAVLPDQVIRQEQAIPPGVAAQVVLPVEVVQAIHPEAVPQDRHLREAGDKQ